MKYKVFLQRINQWILSESEVWRITDSRRGSNSWRIWVVLSATGYVLTKYRDTVCQEKLFSFQNSLTKWHSSIFFFKILSFFNHFVLRKVFWPTCIVTFFQQVWDLVFTCFLGKDCGSTELQALASESYRSYFRLKQKLRETVELICSDFADEVFLELTKADVGAFVSSILLPAVEQCLRSSVGENDGVSPCFLGTRHEAFFVRHLGFVVRESLNLVSGSGVGW